eukprot:tig00000718_g3742.t1
MVGKATPLSYAGNRGSLLAAELATFAVSNSMDPRPNPDLEVSVSSPPTSPCVRATSSPLAELSPAAAVDFADTSSSDESSADSGSAPSSGTSTRIDPTFAPPEPGHRPRRVRSTDFEVITPLGSGGFGSVYLVRHRATGGIYALKVMRKDQLIQREQAHYVKAEKEILLAAGSHPFIADLSASMQSATRVYLVLKFCAGGELFNRLRTEKMLAEDQARFYAAEVALAISHLHSLGIVHRDLKPENILLDREGHVCVTDFGLGRQNIDEESATTLAGTAEYMAPEIVAGVGYGRAVDYYSLGCLLFEMLCGDPPFPRPKNGNVKELHKAILGNKFKLPSYLSNEARSLLKGLLHKDPAQRLGSKAGIEEIKKHPFFFRKINFEKLYARQIVPPFVPSFPGGEMDVSNFDPRATAGGRAASDISRLLDAGAPAGSVPVPAPGGGEADHEAAFKAFSWYGPSLLASLELAAARPSPGAA